MRLSYTNERKEMPPENQQKVDFVAHQSDRKRIGRREQVTPNFKAITALTFKDCHVEENE